MKQCTLGKPTCNGEGSRELGGLSGCPMVIASADAHDAHDAALRNKPEANKRLWHVEDPVQKCSKDSDWTQFVSLGGSVSAVNFSVVSYYSVEYCTFQSHIGRRIGSSHMFLSNHRTGKEYVSLRCMTKLYQHFQSSFHSSLTFVSLRAWQCLPSKSANLLGFGPTPGLEEKPWQIAKANRSDRRNRDS